MTRSRRISPHEWIQDYFCPAVSVLATEEVQNICAKNNLTFTELLQPFSKLTSDITLKDPEGVNHAISSLAINFQDFKRDPSRLINQKLRSDLVSSCTDEPFVSRTFDNGFTVEAPGFTPWFDTWSKLYINSVGVAEHEFCRTHFGVVLAASSGSSNALEDLRDLADAVNKHLREKANSYPQFLVPTPVLYYVLVHDVYDGEDAKAQKAFTQIQDTFGSGLCHYLQLNSRKVTDESQLSNPAMVEYWLGHSHRFFNVDARREGMGMKVITTAMLVGETNALDDEVDGSLESQQNSSNALSLNQGVIDHPLAAPATKSDSPPPPTLPASQVKLHPVTNSNIGTYLTSNDIDRIRILIREFCIKCLVPFIEKQMRVLYEQVTSKKSRSFLSGAKRWFSQNKAGSTGTSVVYSREAPELLLRKLGDLYFMMKLYKNAYSCFHSCKKDFYSDEAWNYYAGAAEMAALAFFMQGEFSKKYPSHYMDDSIVKYVQVCQMPEFAIRATIFDSMCLKYLGLYQEAANRFIKLTSDSKDLRSSLLFEQAAYCFLLSSIPSIRKYAFHIVLAGYRFSKAGQKKHSARAYKQGFAVYKDKGWGLAEDHILYNLGHQSLLLKEHGTASTLFNTLLTMSNPNTSTLQQMCHLREFFIVNHLREKEDKSSALITIPSFDIQNCILDFSCGSLQYDKLPKKVVKLWTDIEKVILDNVHSQDIMLMTTTTQCLMGPISNNSFRPQAYAGEKFHLIVPVRNKFQTNVVLKKIHLLWKLHSNDQSDPLTNDTSDTKELSNAETFVKVDVIDNVIVEKESTSNIVLSVKPLQPGELDIIGIEYGIKAQFPHTESTDYTVRGKQNFYVRGPRLNSTKEQKTKLTYGKDLRLSMDVLETPSKLEIADFKFPDTLMQGEMRSIELTIRNVGASALKNVHIFNNFPGLLSIHSQTHKHPKHLFDHHVIKDSSLSEAKEDGSLDVVSLDVIKVPLNDGILNPGKSEKIFLWMRGPERLGSEEIVLFFYYQSDVDPVHSKKRKNHRMTVQHYTLKVLPSVAVSATSSAMCKYDNKPGEGIVINLTNISKTISDILVSQVSLVSENNLLSRCQSGNQTFPISKTDSLSIALATETLNSVGTHPKKIHFTNMCFKGMKDSVRMDYKPHVDFLKAGFIFGEHGKVRVPSLEKDLALVLWEGKSQGSHGKFHGLTYVQVQPMAQRLETDRSDEETGTDEQSQICKLVTTTQPCELTVDMESYREHDFAQYAICTVPLTLKVKNPESSKTSKFFLTVKNDEEQDLQLLGCMDIEVKLVPGEERQFKFRILVSASGLFQSSALQIEMIDDASQTPEHFIPFPICFIVKDKV